VDKDRIKQLECDLSAALNDCVLLAAKEKSMQDKLIHIEEVVGRGMEVFSNGVSEALKIGAFKDNPLDFRGPPVSSPAIETQRPLATTNVATNTSAKASPNHGGELSQVQLQPVSITISKPASSFEPKRWASKFGRQTFSKALHDATMIKSRASPDKLSFYNYHKNVVADKNEDMEWFKKNNPNCLNWFVDGFETDFNYSQREQFFHYIAPALVTDCQEANGWQEVWDPLEDKYRFAVVAVMMYDSFDPELWEQANFFIQVRDYFRSCKEKYFPFVLQFLQVQRTIKAAYELVELDLPSEIVQIQLRRTLFEFLAIQNISYFQWTSQPQYNAWIKHLIHSAFAQAFESSAALWTNHAEAIALRLFKYTSEEQAFFITFNEKNPSLPLESRSSWSFDTSDFKHSFPHAETNLLDDETMYSDRLTNSETYFQGSDTNAEGDERDSEEEGIGQDISSDSNSYEPALQHSDVVSPSIPQRLLQNSKGMSDFDEGGGSVTSKQVLHEKSAFEDFEAAMNGYSSGFNASKRDHQDSIVVSHSSPRRLLQNSKGMSEFALRTTLSSAIHGFQDKSAFEKFEAANRGTSSDSRTSKHALHGSEVISRFPPRRVLSNLGVLPTCDDFPLTGSTDFYFSDNPPNVSRKKATANLIFSSARADLQQEVSTSPSSSDVGNLPNGGPCAGEPFEEPLGEVTFSVAPSPPLFPPLWAVPVIATPVRRPLISASAARRLLQSGPASAVASVKKPGKLPSSAPRGSSPMLFGSPQSKSTPPFRTKPASSSKMVSSAVKPSPTTIPIPPVAELLKVQRQLRRAPPRATQRQTTISAATLADDGRRRVRPAD
jgi:hypothetical protein